MIQVFFNRPDQAVPIDDLLQDLESATQRIVLASAWFTDHTIAQALIDSRAPTKLALFNKSDSQRGDRVAYRRLIEAPVCMSACLVRSLLRMA